MDAETRLGAALANGVLLSLFSPLVHTRPDSWQCWAQRRVTWAQSARTRWSARLCPWGLAYGKGRARGVSGELLAWTGGQMRVRGAGSCWWPRRSRQRLGMKVVDPEQVGEGQSLREERPTTVQPAGSRTECGLPGAPPQSSLGSCTLLSLPTHGTDSEARCSDPIHLLHCPRPTTCSLVACFPTWTVGEHVL